MTLFDDIFDGLGSPMLNQAFSETGVYSPTVGPARPVDTIVTSEIDYDVNQESEEEVERIQVDIKRDDDVGIAAPQLGDRYTRPIANDPDRRPFVFTGTVVEQRRDRHVLRFTRTRRVAAGGDN